MSNNVKSYLDGHLTVNTGAFQNLANTAKTVGSAVNDFLQKGFDAQAQTKFMVPNPFVDNRDSSSPSEDGGGGDGGDGGISPISSAFYSDESGNVRPSDPNLDAMMKMIQQTTQANNEWSAAQAQKQMDFQKEMSSTAHQREVADLKAAGLNPVLSAGGSGASTPNGAQGDTDTSNTRIMADIAMSAIESLGMSAAAFGAGAGSGRSRTGKSDSLFGKISDAYASNKLVKKLVDTTLGAGQFALGGLALAKGKGAMSAAGAAKQIAGQIRLFN